MSPTVLVMHIVVTQLEERGLPLSLFPECMYIIREALDLPTNDIPKDRLGDAIALARQIEIGGVA